MNPIPTIVVLKATVSDDVSVLMSSALNAERSEPPRINVLIPSPVSHIRVIMSVLYILRCFFLLHFQIIYVFMLLLLICLNHLNNQFQIKHIFENQES